LLTISVKPDGIAAVSQARIAKADNFGLPLQDSNNRKPFSYAFLRIGKKYFD
jgi:hypothetical protein